MATAFLLPSDEEFSSSDLFLFFPVPEAFYYPFFEILGYLVSSISSPSLSLTLR